MGKSPVIVWRGELAREWGTWSRRLLAGNEFHPVSPHGVLPLPGGRLRIPQYDVEFDRLVRFLLGGDWHRGQHPRRQHPSSRPLLVERSSPHGTGLEHPPA